MTTSSERIDDLGFRLDPAAPASRVVSLVPSLTESIAETRPEALVAATQWCTYPEGLDVPRVRGTKNPDCAAIIALAPDLVIANQEENREIDVRRLRDAGIPVWVTRIETVAEALTSMERMFEVGLGWPVPEWLRAARIAWDTPSEPIDATVAVVIWRNPWMVVGPRTFAHDLLGRLGLTNAFGDSADRYPKVEIADMDRAGIDLVLLPDEPYVFNAQDGPDAFSQARTALVNGRLLTWYGPSLVASRAELTSIIQDALAQGHS